MNGYKIPGKAVLIGIAGLVLILLIVSTYFGVDAGERGVVLRFGEVNRVVEPGPNFKIPLAEQVVYMTVRVQKTTTKRKPPAAICKPFRRRWCSTITLNPPEPDKCIPTSG